MSVSSSAGWRRAGSRSPCGTPGAVRSTALAVSSRLPRSSSSSLGDSGVSGILDGALMDMPAHKTFRSAASAFAVVAISEAVLASAARRLRYGRRCGDCGARVSVHRPLRRLALAIVHEMVMESAVAFYIKRQRLQSAVDHMVDSAVENEAAQQYAQARVPRQRVAPEVERARPSVDVIDLTTPTPVTTTRV